MKPAKIIAEMRVSPQLAPFMEQHGIRSVAAINKFLAPCGSIDDKLGALGVLAQVLLAYGDSLQAIELSRASTGAKN